jgi:hypothetical protein
MLLCQLDRDLDTLKWLSSEVSLEQQALHSALSKLSSRLNMQLPSSSSSSSAAGLQAASLSPTAEVSELEGLVVQLCGAGESFRQNISDAADAVVSVRNLLQQLAAAHNSHASGVAQLQQLVGEKQQQLQENQQGAEELTQQVGCSSSLVIQ